MIPMWPDVEHLVVDYLANEFAALDEDVTIGVGVPAGWVGAAKPHVRVAWDGTPIMDWPIIQHTTVRLVAYASTTTEAKRLASLAQGVLAAHPGGSGIAACIPLTGTLPARDPETEAEIASTTTRVTVRSIPAA